MNSLLQQVHMLHFQLDSIGWGVGVNIKETVVGFDNSIIIGELDNYGYPTVENPHLFSPDRECCSEQEIQNWEEAKKKWNEIHKIVII